MPGTRPGMTKCNRLSQRLFEKLFELRQMFRHLTHGGRSRGRTPCISHSAMLGADLTEHPLQEGIDEEPGAHVARLLLAPHHLRLLETGKLGYQRLGRERIKLLETKDIDVINAALPALIIEI